MNRMVWFVAGATAGVYAVTKARRAAEAFTPDGLRDRLAGLSLGAHLVGEEIKDEMATREHELRERLGLMEQETGDRALPGETERPLELMRKGND